LKPLRPVVCAVCGKQLGSWWKYGKTWFPEFHECTQRCEELKKYARHEVEHSKPLNVPRNWQDNEEWSAVVLAAGYAEWRVRDE